MTDTDQPTPKLEQAGSPAVPGSADYFCQWCYDRGLRYQDDGTPWRHATECPRNKLADASTVAAMDKMEALLRKRELIRTGHAGVNGAGQLVDIRDIPQAVPLPRHKLNGKDHL